MRTKLLGRFRDVDGTEKFVYRNKKGIIEVTWIKNFYKGGITNFCLPTHYYCNLGCKFCHLTTEGSKKMNMAPIHYSELLDALMKTWKFIDPQPKLLLSFMGVGEGLLNPELVTGTFEAFKKKIENKELGKTSSLNLALATMAPNKERLQGFIEKMLKEAIPLKIHFSLHSPKDEERYDLIPCTNVSVDEALSLISNYRQAINDKPEVSQEISKYHRLPDSAEIHYTIIKDINDGDEELEKIIELGKKYKLILKLLKFNPTKDLKRSPTRERYWYRRLSKDYDAPVVQYSPPGPNIGSSCGQFTKHYYLDTKPEEYEDFLAWKEKYEVKE